LGIRESNGFFVQVLWTRKCFLLSSILDYNSYSGFWLLKWKKSFNYVNFNYNLVLGLRISIKEIRSEYQFNSVLAARNILGYSDSKWELTSITMYFLISVFTRMKLPPYRTSKNYLLRNLYCIYRVICRIFYNANSVGFVRFLRSYTKCLIKITFYFNYHQTGYWNLVFYNHGEITGHKHGADDQSCGR